MTRFAGYAALFDRVDHGGDIIRRGAFAGATAPVPLYWQHDPHRRVGTVDTLTEDLRGLRVVGSTSAAVRAGTGLSFGYRTRAVRHGTYRELKHLDLIEISLVAAPMQPLARVHFVETQAGEDHDL